MADSQSHRRRANVPMTLNEILVLMWVGALIFAVGAFFGAALALALSRGSVKLLRMPSIAHMFRSKAKETTS